MSYARWLTEAMYTEEVLPFAGVYEVFNVSEKQFGFTLGRFSLDCGMRFLFVSHFFSHLSGLGLVADIKKK
jgi:hypothetical protein